MLLVLYMPSFTSSAYLGFSIGCHHESTDNWSRLSNWTIGRRHKTRGWSGLFTLMENDTPWEYPTITRCKFILFIHRPSIFKGPLYGFIQANANRLFSSENKEMVWHYGIASSVKLQSEKPVDLHIWLVFNKSNCHTCIQIMQWITWKNDE